MLDCLSMGIFDGFYHARYGERHGSRGILLRLVAFNMAIDLSPLRSCCPSQKRRTKKENPLLESVIASHSFGMASLEQPKIQPLQVQEPRTPNRN